MRDRGDGDVLEPLPVYDERGRHDPVGEPGPPSAADVVARAREVLGALRAVVGERTAVRGASPWAAAPAPVASPRPPRWATTFSRMTGLHPSLLAYLPDWWQAHERGGRVRVTRRLALERPAPGPRGAWRARGWLRGAWPSRPVPVELLLWPHLGSWTKCTLEPQRAVLAGRRYFRRGNRVLDVLTERLRRELRPSRTPRPGDPAAPSRASGARTPRRRRSGSPSR
ncbi:MAG: hypothetical protein KatS3mg009_1050 [Acidimicrobiia bacterium]|nr:MAG: hypothetical protein KatS3mg009_1050 [Acidimicrobiia bacterium]